MAIRVKFSRLFTVLDPVLQTRNLPSQATVVDYLKVLNNDSDNVSDNDDAHDDGVMIAVGRTWFTITFSRSSGLHPILIIFDQSLTELRTMYIQSVNRT